jgi:hypothetical protein
MSAANNSIQRALGNHWLQAKLKVSQSKDRLEKEADDMAEKVIAGSVAGDSKMQRGIVSSAAVNKSQLPQRKCKKCEAEKDEDNYIQRKPKSGGSIPGAISSPLPGEGRPLSTADRQFYEPRFEQDFDSVRIHNNDDANRAAGSLNARAFTVGSHIVFGKGEYRPGSTDGRRLMAHELAHTIQQQSSGNLAVQRQPLTQAQLNTMCYTNSTNQPDPSASEPERHPTYEQWLASFQGIATFRAEDNVAGATSNLSGFQVLGTRAHRYGDSSATVENEPVPETGSLRRGEGFIDHPTNQWVINCLPPNLRAAAYQLPSDCADIAVILRHVWLAAHHRTEQYHGWTVGDAAGDANQRRVTQLIHDVGSWNASSMLNPYSDAQGNALTDFNDAVNRVHPGDILVWEHRRTSSRGGRVRASRTGGHVQTVTEVRRSGNRVTAIRVLQGNQPIFSGAARDILTSEGAANTDPDSSAGQTLRNAPGRRIESSNAISLSNMTNPVNGRDIWGEVDSRNTDGSVHEFTVLVAAGPPRAAARPAMRRIGGSTVRRLSDWFRSLRSATAVRLQAVMEAALQEARAILDGGNSVSTADATGLGEAAGENLWSRAKASVRHLYSAANRRALNPDTGDVGNRSHFEPLHRIRAVIRALGGIRPNRYHGNPAAAARVRTTFTSIDQEFNFAARGGTDIQFNRRMRRGGELVKVLVTGFDPFGSSPPGTDDWNPSGAAAMTLDGQEVSLGRRDKAAVEGIVYPVSFSEFNQGIVERMVRQAGADAVLTVSLDNNLQAGGPVQIEQFTAGVHGLRRLQTHRLFPPEQASITGLRMRGVGGGGAALIRSSADLPGIAGEVEQRDRQGNVLVPRPTVARDVTFRFANAQVAASAAAALGLRQTRPGPVLVVRSERALAAIMSRMTRISDRHGLTAQINFTVNNQQFRAGIVEGPGGNFLSNEVAYRTQRELLRQGGTATSFHTHVPNAAAGGTSVPASGSGRRNALWIARDAIRLLVSTLRRIIQSVGNRIVAQRGP